MQPHPRSPRSRPHSIVPGLAVSNHRQGAVRHPVSSTHIFLDTHHRTIAVIPPASAPLQPCCQPLYTDPGPSEISLMSFYVVMGSLLFFCNPGAALWPPQPHAPTVGCTTILGSQCTLTRGNKCSLVATPPLFFLSFFLSLFNWQTNLALTSLTHAAILEPPVGQCCRCRHQSDEHVPPSTSKRRQAQWCAQLCCCHVKPNLKTPYHCFCA